MTLEARIASLDDTSAEQLLLRFAAAQPTGHGPDTLDAALVDQLGGLLDVSAAPATSPGSLARTALVLLAEDPIHRIGITALVETPAPQRYALVETALVISAVLIALQTHVHFDRNKEGKWSIRVEKKPTESSLLKELVRRLLSFR